jgi:hypothetical protein
VLSLADNERKLGAQMFKSEKKGRKQDHENQERKSTKAKAGNFCPKKSAKMQARRHSARERMLNSVVN